MTDRATKSGIAAEAQQKIYNKFKSKLAHEILVWVSNITEIKDLNTDGTVENFVEVSFVKGVESKMIKSKIKINFLIIKFLAFQRWYPSLQVII